MGKLIGIGEALIDFIPVQTGVNLKKISDFKRVAGGAPANVCACVKRLGSESLLLTKLGIDGFGDYLVDTLNEIGVNTKHIKRTNKANTALAFVAFKEDGSREFSFYRNPSADMLLEASEIDESVFKQGDILHFCSVNLIDAPVRKAHDQAIKYAKENKMLISFDPNVRLPLWQDHNEYKKIINKYISYTQILKISDDELEFIAGTTSIEEALNGFFDKGVRLVIYTEGSKGARAFTKNKQYSSSAYSVKTIDTTGAGDSFIGAFLYLLLTRKVTIETIDKINLDDYLQFANAVGAIVTTKKGAITAMPTEKEVIKFLNKKSKKGK